MKTKWKKQQQKKPTHTYLIFECVCTGKKEKQEIMLFIDKFGLYHFFFHP